MTGSLEDTVQRLFCDNGFSIDRIGKSLGLPYAKVCRILKAEYLLNKLPSEAAPLNKMPSEDAPRKKTLHLKPDNIARLLELYGQGKTIKEVAAVIGCSAVTVFRRTAHLRVRRAGADRRLKPKEVSRLVYLYQRGLRAQAIASCMGCSISTVHKQTKFLRH